ncbi:MAG: hypothetical protein EZS28_011882 [Streblomastix strix]|uniref:Uncharacterized protein n=1 Tax=Streblomastix strix TaxID=222440 RepID=A0A5J4WDJ5_9EUKA|nr:MAG: hypothetical protein EZS28_011882 [Streblomastix strix]
MSSQYLKPKPLTFTQSFRYAMSQSQPKAAEAIKVVGSSQVNIQSLLSVLQFGKCANLIVPMSETGKFLAKIVPETMTFWKQGGVMQVQQAHIKDIERDEKKKKELRKIQKKRQQINNQQNNIVQIQQNKTMTNEQKKQKQEEIQKKIDILKQQTKTEGFIEKVGKDNVSISRILDIFNEKNEMIESDTSSENEEERKQQEKEDLEMQFGLLMEHGKKPSHLQQSSGQVSSHSILLSQISSKATQNIQLLDPQQKIEEQKRSLMKYATKASLMLRNDSFYNESSQEMPTLDFANHDPINLYRKQQKQIKTKKQIQNTFTFQTIKDGKPRFVKWVKNKNSQIDTSDNMQVAEIIEDQFDYYLQNGNFEWDGQDEQQKEDEITSVILVEVRLVPIFPNRIGILPSIKIRKMINGFELDEEALEKNASDNINISPQEKLEMKKQIKEQRDLLLKNQEQRVRLKSKREIQQQIRNSLKSKKLPQRLIVRTRTTDAKSEMLETQPASFSVEADTEQAGKLLRDAARGYFYEELDMITDERSPIVETALTTFAIPIIDAAKRQGEIYLVRFVDEQRGYAVAMGICVHHMKMVRRLFETPRIGMMMQLYLSPIQSGNVPYPPVIVSRVTGNSLGDWDSITDEIIRREQELEKLEENEDKIQLDQQIGLQRSSVEGYSRKSLAFTCVPIVKRPIRIQKSKKIIKDGKEMIIILIIQKLTPQIPLPPFQVINEYYITPLPPPLNITIENNKKFQKIGEKKKDKKNERDDKNFTESETISISFVNRNGFASMTSTFFDPKIYFGGHPAVICEFYAPIITQDTTQTSIMKFAGEIFSVNQMLGQEVGLEGQTLQLETALKIYYNSEQMR